VSLGEITPGCHLWWSEVACRDGTIYPLDLRERLLKVVIPAWSGIRAEVCLVVGHDTPITVTSFYRPRAYNRLVGGAADGRHPYGDAWDSTAAPELSTLAYGCLVARVARQHPELLIRGVGLYLEDGVVHVDCRPSERVVLWRAVYTHHKGKLVRTYLDWTGTGVE
jgi:hypothetical protein